ncbi:Uncharacterized UPF0442 protein [Venturia inaequalis]|uniref:Uncharacterized protein n=1 Tax=Venturia inaequalis TaxID=5025 RepID=A0A8H3VRE6_VENIN|nr:hypothetical protein EG327_006474 [Venturia inaequalis]RDI88064.1 Uncharacterized UPF0442 protein [Venturia inaequalis]
MRAHLISLLIANLATQALSTAPSPSTRSTTTLTRTVYVSRCSTTTTTPEPTYTQNNPPTTTIPKLDLREIVVDQGGNTILATQYPTETTAWFAQKINGVVTWLPAIYTQTFATTVLDQLPRPLEGKIGTEKVALPVATGGAGISHEASSGGADGREDLVGAIWLVSVAAGVGVSLVAGFVVF